MSKFHIIFGILVIAVCAGMYVLLGGTTGSSSSPSSTEASAPPPSAPSADDQAIKGFKIN